METNSLSFLSEHSKSKYPDFLFQKMSDFYINRLEREWDNKHILKGNVPGEGSINLTTNDYLHLSTDCQVLKAQIKILNQISSTPLMSASFVHGDAPQSLLEKRLASFFESESAILCQSGYVANLGLMQSLVENTNTPIFIDMMTHMSIWDGIRMGGGKAIPFLHNDVKHLEKKIDEFGSGIIVVDSIYSSNGSVAPLTQIAEIARAKNCMLIVDESHSFGTHGIHGKGLVVELGISDIVLFRTASLAKAFASRAGLILCHKEFGDFFNVTSRPQIFSSALMPSDIAGLNMVLEIINSEIGDVKRLKLFHNSRQLKKLLLNAGIDVNDSESQIIALKASSENQMMRLKENLEKERIFGAPFCTPATPKKKPALRLSLHSELQSDDLEYITYVCKNTYSKLSI